VPPVLDRLGLRLVRPENIGRPRVELIENSVAGGNAGNCAARPQCACHGGRAGQAKHSGQKYSSIHGNLRSSDLCVPPFTINVRAHEPFLNGTDGNSGARRGAQGIAPAVEHV